MAETDEELKELKEKTKQSLDKLVLEKFPQKILEFEKLIERNFSSKNSVKIVTEVNIAIPNNTNIGNDRQSKMSREGLDKRVFLFANGEQPCNKKLTELIAVVKPLMLDFINDMRLLKFSVQLMVPKVEDGNNFGVQIQEATIRAVVKAENISLARFNQFYRYYYGRGSVVTLVARYPHCDDYRKALKEEDEKFYLILCLIVGELRDHYISLQDCILKNLEKIKNPRSAQDVNIY